MRLEEHFYCFAEVGDNVLKLVIYGHAPPHNLVSSKKSLSLTGHWHILESHVDSSSMTGFVKSRLTECWKRWKQVQHRYRYRLPMNWKYLLMEFLLARDSLHNTVIHYKHPVFTAKERLPDPNWSTADVFVRVILRETYGFCWKMYFYTRYLQKIPREAKKNTSLGHQIKCNILFAIYLNNYFSSYSISTHHYQYWNSLF